MFTQNQNKHNRYHEEYEKRKLSYYGQTQYNVKPLALPPALINDIHSILIANYIKEHEYNAESFYNLVESRYKLLTIDMNHDFLEHCILHASNLLNMMHDHYADVMRVMFSIDQNDTKSEPALMSFYIGINIMKTFGLGNRWPIFNDTIVPGIHKNLNIVNEKYAIGYEALNSLPEDQKATFENLQYRFLLNVECVTKTLLTNPIFTAQYLLEKESTIIDKSLIPFSCEYLIKEINAFKNLNNGLPNTIIDPLVSNLNNLAIKYNLLEDQKFISTSGCVANSREGLFYHDKKDESTKELDTRNSLNYK